jgi:hypothetical protein
MAATYDPNLTSDLDWVRRLIGDTDVANARVSDEEIRALLTEKGNRFLAAATAGDFMLARAGSMISKSVGDLSISWSDNPEGAYRKYVQSLRLQGMSQTRGVLRIMGDCS